MVLVDGGGFFSCADGEKPTEHEKLTGVPEMRGNRGDRARKYDLNKGPLTTDAGPPTLEPTRSTGEISASAGMDTANELTFGFFLSFMMGGSKDVSAAL